MNRLKTKKITLISTLFIALIIPITVIAANRQTRTNSKASSPDSPPPTFVPTPSYYPPTIPYFEFDTAYSHTPMNLPITGRDSDAYDLLQISATGLPPDLQISNCHTQSGEQETSITCDLSGKIATAGTYDIAITITDKMGHTGRIARQLVVKNWYQSLPLLQNL